MQKTKAVFPKFLICFFVAATCILQFFALLTPSSDKGTVTALSYTSYALIALILAFSYVYASGCRRTVKAICYSTDSLGLAVSSALVCAGMLYDFVHQCYNCYNYFENSGYIEYNYIIPIAVSGAFALISCAYYIAFYLTVRGTGVDYKRFNLLHFAPLMWAFFKLFNLVTSLLDIKSGAQDICNFILLVSFLPFFLAFAAASDKKEKPAGKLFITSLLFCAAMCFIVSLPRLAVLLFGGAGKLESVTFSSPTYFTFGLFAVTLLRENRRAENSVIIGE